jgi:NADPH:quinone reductase
MRAFALEELGKPGAVVEVPVPEPAEGQVRIRVAAAGLNPFDNAVVQGFLKDQMEHRFPLIPGMDASGTVDALGEGVIELAIGDEVFGSAGKRHLGEGRSPNSPRCLPGRSLGNPGPSTTPMPPRSRSRA